MQEVKGDVGATLKQPANTGFIVATVEHLKARAVHEALLAKDPAVSCWNPAALKEETGAPLQMKDQDGYLATFQVKDDGKQIVPIDTGSRATAPILLVKDCRYMKTSKCSVVA